MVYKVYLKTVAKHHTHVCWIVNIRDNLNLPICIILNLDDSGNLPISRIFFFVKVKKKSILTLFVRKFVQCGNY